MLKSHKDFLDFLYHHRGASTDYSSPERYRRAERFHELFHKLFLDLGSDPIFHRIFADGYRPPNYDYQPHFIVESPFMTTHTKDGYSRRNFDPFLTVGISSEALFPIRPMYPMSQKELSSFVHSHVERHDLSTESALYVILLLSGELILMKNHTMPAFNEPHDLFYRKPPEKNWLGLMPMPNDNPLLEQYRLSYISTRPLNALSLDSNL